MSKTVCQNTQQSLNLKLTHPKQSGWGCIETLTSVEKPEGVEAYVHPLAKKSASVLSEKSLEMCTENLGSETGTDQDCDVFSVMSMDSEGEEYTPIARKPRQKREVMITRQKPGYESLPPPLTSAIRVRMCRDNGRLVMMAVPTPARRPSIRVERSEGRVTMSLVEEEEEVVEEAEGDVVECCGFEEGIDGGNEKVGVDMGNIGEIEEGVDGRNEEVWGELGNIGDEVEGMDWKNKEVGGGMRNIGEKEEGMDWKNKEVVGEMRNKGESVEGMDGKNKEVGEVFGIGEFQRLRRCKEGGRGCRKLINWGTLRVAT